MGMSTPTRRCEYYQDITMMEDFHQPGNLNDEASQYVGALVRDHLMTAVESYRGPRLNLAQNIDVTI